MLDETSGIVTNVTPRGEGGLLSDALRTVVNTTLKSVTIGEGGSKISKKSAT